MSDAGYLNVLPVALVAVDRKLSIIFINHAAENLFSISASQLLAQSLDALPAFEGEIRSFCERVFASGEAMTCFDYMLRMPLNFLQVTMHITPVLSESLKVDQILITIDKTDGIGKLSGSAIKQETTRAAGVMAAMMAHEVKNPLSGIRGAAQLLRDDVSSEQQVLTDLICKETDRIRDILNQVEIFAGGAVEAKHAVNIHEVLQYVISVAQTGFANNMIFKERYDPSLPEVYAHRDLLVQMFLNLVKNSAEVLEGRDDGAITITTSYRSGYRVINPQGEGIALPVMVSIEDNGPGIDASIRDHLFEPFVSSKEDGRGLGLAVVAKIAQDLGVVVELDKEFELGTRFNIWLPVDSGR